MFTTNNKPADRVRESTIEISIFLNPEEKDLFPKATIANSWKDGTEWKRTNVYTEAGLEALASAALIARRKMRKMRLESKKAAVATDEVAA